MKRLSVLALIIVCVTALQSSVKYSDIPPTGYTGATGNNCRNCHGSYALNTSGSVVMGGFPVGGFKAGTSYPLTITINHGTADRKIWGFSIIAVDGSGKSIGNFSTTNNYVAINGSELSHYYAPVTAALSTYTYNNLVWKAPASGSGTVKFYYVGVAGNNANGSSGDYVYTGSTSTTLPIELADFSATSNNNHQVLLQWQTSTEINSNRFEVERSDDGQFFFNIGEVKASGGSKSSSNYSFIDNKAASSGGYIFYRLKLVDNDGSFQYSKSIQIKPSNKIIELQKVYPSVLKAGNTVYAELNSNACKTVIVSLFDVNGRRYLMQQANIKNGYNKISVNIPSTVAGEMLFLRISTNGFEQTESLIIQ